jgi:hypothetical protein
LRAATRSRLAAALAVAVVSLAARAASAQPADPQKVATAQALFADAQAAMDRKDWAIACPKLEEVTRLLPSGVGGQLTLAQCYEGAGKLASAWTTYLVAEAAATQTNRPEQAKQAHDKGAALRPKLAQIVIVVPEAVRALPGLVIERDGTAVGAAVWGTAVSVDKGPHLIVVSATGRSPWQKNVDVPSDGAQVSVDVEAPAASAAPPALKPEAPPPEPPPPVPPPKPPEASRSPGPWIVGGIGVAALIGGAVTGGLVLSNKSTFDGSVHMCGAGAPFCTTSAGDSARSTINTLGPVTTALLAAGGAGVAAGAIWLGVRGRSGSSARFGVAPTSAGTTWRVEGSW